jgi:hypothetical protein
MPVNSEQDCCWLAREVGMQWETGFDLLCVAGQANVSWVRIPLSPPFLRYSSFQYPIVRIHREITEEPCDVALILRESCSFFAVG